MQCADHAIRSAIALQLERRAQRQRITPEHIRSCLLPLIACIGNQATACRKQQRSDLAGQLLAKNLVAGQTAQNAWLLVVRARLGRRALVGIVDPGQGVLQALVEHGTDDATDMGTEFAEVLDRHEAPLGIDSNRSRQTLDGLGQGPDQGLLILVDAGDEGDLDIPSDPGQGVATLGTRLAANLHVRPGTPDP